MNLASTTSPAGRSRTQPLPRGPSLPPAVPGAFTAALSFSGQFCPDACALHPGCLQLPCCPRGADSHVWVSCPDRQALRALPPPTVPSGASHSRAPALPGHSGSLLRCSGEALLGGSRLPDCRPLLSACPGQSVSCSYPPFKSTLALTVCQLALPLLIFCPYLFGSLPSPCLLNIGSEPFILA